ncbi:MAG TPA: lipopolysaccharide biosynthesis protein [Limnobacter sp.]|uniref:lipopolysaccharide biosynthesis protein n=1 Tax=Limnobacter sp. TaxID=2003368 RepID=UPI002EDA47B9
MSNRQSLRGAYLLVGAKGLSAVLGLLSTLVLARLLTPEDYGLVVLVDAAVTVLASLTELQLAAVLIHLPHLTDAHLRTAWTMNCLRAALLATLVVLMGPVLASVYAKPELQGIAWGISLSLFMGGLINPKMTLLVRELNFKSEFILSLSQKLTGLIVTVVAALVLKNYWALVLGTIATQACALVVSYRCVPFRPAFTLVHMRSLWGYSVWLTGSLFVKTLTSKLDQFVVGKLFSVQTTGLYSVATRLSNVLFTDTLAAALRVISPSLVAHQHQPAELNQAYLRSLGVVCMLFLPIAVMASALSTPLIRLALGTQWMGVAPAFQWLVAALCIEAIGSVALSVVLATLNTKLAFQRDVLSLLARCTCMAVGVFTAGFEGLLWGRFASALLDALLYFRMAAQVTALSLWTQLLHHWPCGLVSVWVFGVLYLLQGQHNWVQVSPFHTALWLVAYGGLGLLLLVGGLALLWWLRGQPQSTEWLIARYVGQTIKHRLLKNSLNAAP